MAPLCTPSGVLGTYLEFYEGVEKPSSMCMEGNTWYLIFLVSILARKGKKIPSLAHTYLAILELVFHISNISHDLIPFIFRIQSSGGQIHYTPDDVDDWDDDDPDDDLDI